MPCHFWCEVLYCICKMFLHMHCACVCVCVCVCVCRGSLKHSFAIVHQCKVLQLTWGVVIVHVALLCGGGVGWGGVGLWRGGVFSIIYACTMYIYETLYSNHPVYCISYLSIFLVEKLPVVSIASYNNSSSIIETMNFMQFLLPSVFVSFKPKLQQWSGNTRNTSLW